MSNEVLADIYAMQIPMIKMHLQDFSDVDMLVRPCEGGKHAAWHLGHLTSAEAMLINSATPGAIPEQDAAFRERYSGKGAHLNDGFASKDKLLALFEQTRDTGIAWLEKLSEADMARAMPKQFEGFAPTVAHLAHTIPIHATMHLGQIQVIRRRLGKPVLF